MSSPTEEKHTSSTGSLAEAKDSPFHNVDPEKLEAERKRIIRKIDYHLLPFVALLYLLSFLDRANIGNARVAGMAKDAKLDGLKYNVVAAVFFIPYSLAEVPSNVALKLVRPSRWIPSIMVAWGIVMTLMCLCKTYQGLIAARVFLGLAESGLFPGVTFYLSLWYRRRDVAARIAIFFSAATVAGAFGGLLAFGIEHMEGIGGLHGWQWIFCLEGIATIVVALLSYAYMYDYPSTASFLTDQEKAMIIKMLEDDSQGLATHFNIRFVWQALADYKSYMQVGIYIGFLIPVYAVALFAPTIVNQLGFTAAQAQLLMVPIFVAGCITTVAIGFLSDRHNLRGPYIIGSAVVSLIGFIVLYTQTKPGVAYAGAVLATMGVYPTIAVCLAWAGSAAGGDVRKGVMIAMVIGIGNLGGICASFIYIHPPRFHEGHGTIIGWLSLSILLTFVTMWDYRRINRKKEEQCRLEGIDESRRKEFADMGSESPLFRYTI